MVFSWLLGKLFTIYVEIGKINLIVYCKCRTSLSMKGGLKSLFFLVYKAYLICKEFESYILLIYFVFSYTPNKLNYNVFLSFIFLLLFSYNEYLIWFLNNIKFNFVNPYLGSLL